MTEAGMSPLSRIVTRASYGMSQLSRVAWYVGHGVALRRLSQAAQRNEAAQRNDGATMRRRARKRAKTDAPVPDRSRLYADMAELFMQDLANVEAGIYPLPSDRDGSLFKLIARSRLFFSDLPDVHQRRERAMHDEVLDGETRGKRPRYYLQNFHFQSGGWMTDDSAERYDTQVEVLFNGSANAIRRQALPALHEVFAGRDQRELSLLDIGCGTGRFLDFVKQAWPRLAVHGLDMSDAYIRHARRHLRGRARTSFAVGKAEAIRFPTTARMPSPAFFCFTNCRRRCGVRRWPNSPACSSRVAVSSCSTRSSAATGRIMRGFWNCSRRIITSLIIRATSMKILPRSREIAVSVTSAT